MSSRPDFDAVTKGQTTLTPAFINSVIRIIQIVAGLGLISVSWVINNFGSICGSV